jgi:hypothetical protein
MAEMEQLSVKLPGDLVAFLQRVARRDDRTPTGVIRHLVAEAARLEPPAETQPFGSVLPNVAGNAESIAEARALISQMRTRQARLARLGGEASAASDMECEKLKFEVEILEERVKQAEKMMRPARNGGA